MVEPRTYPAGVPSWVDTEQPDLDAATRFCGGLFGWTFENAMPPGADGSYLIARLDGQDVAAIAPGTGRSWHTYVAVDDADATAAAAVAAGATMVAEPYDAGPGGRTATMIDPVGAEFRLWQARRRLGAQLVNAPGSWNFSILRTADPTAALAFYRTVAGWVSDEVVDGLGSMIRVPGYGDHLARTADPGIYERQVGAPAGFADVVAGMEQAGPDEPSHWLVKFSVADRDHSVATAERLGATVVDTVDTAWTREAVLEDPQGARFGVSQFHPTG